MSAGLAPFETAGGIRLSSSWHPWLATASLQSFAFECSSSLWLAVSSHGPFIRTEVTGLKAQANTV